MTLLLGPPASGKTTLLLALAGKLQNTLKVSIPPNLSFMLLYLLNDIEFIMYEVLVQVEGEVKYNGHALNEFVPERTSTYISQHDTFMGEMTVRETLNFSARCQGVGSRYGIFLL